MEASIYCKCHSKAFFYAIYTIYTIVEINVYIIAMYNFFWLVFEMVILIYIFFFRLACFLENS